MQHFLAQDDPTISERVKSLSRRKSAPSENGFPDAPARLSVSEEVPDDGEHVLGTEYLQLDPCLRGHTDHAGCAVTLRSTVGLCAVLGRHCVKHGSRIQSTISFSRAENRNGTVGCRGLSVGLGLQDLMHDWGLAMSLEVLSDSSAPREFEARRGLGRMRHPQSDDSSSWQKFL